MFTWKDLCLIFSQDHDPEEKKKLPVCWLRISAMFAQLRTNDGDEIFHFQQSKVLICNLYIYNITLQITEEKKR